MIDEKKIFKIQGENDKELELQFTFKSFKRLNAMTGNGFKAIDDFNTNTEERLVLLPVMIKATSGTDMTLEEIEEDFLGLNYLNILKMSEIIFRLLNFELKSEVKAEEKDEVINPKKAKPKPKKN
ncbi:hypothetical protein KPL39_02170 [Clostridium gasigenes]|uniref:hypothetical protein n=1 Tax=Clostridium gasigenes TaxID=94869 RepID=UPI001C0A93C2|nr:hypothetical protein [Clostridium gasigenes]MBU3135067.1 hypothetical protein [Clostridium gasigenes]